jgi:hypothetical protein
VFFITVLTVVFVEGTSMYVNEQDANPDFSNIPQSIYCAIVAITTVGYGDDTLLSVCRERMKEPGLAVLCQANWRLRQPIRGVRHGHGSGLIPHRCLKVREIRCFGSIGCQMACREAHE